MCDLKKNESSSSNDEDNEHHLLNAINEHQQQHYNNKNEELYHTKAMIENNEIKIDNNSDVYVLNYVISLLKIKKQLLFFKQKK